ncbi:MAG: class I SAM-dependent methyltransferase [Phycisphaeraceae bacterium]
MTPLRKIAGALYWSLRGRIERSLPLRLLRNATNPLWVARRCLLRTVRQQAHHARGRLLDVGCGGQPYRPLFTDVTRYIGVDLPGAQRIDVAASALALPFADAAFDTVLCNQVLEHVPDPGLLIREVQRVLRPGGTLLLTTPQVWGLHHEPHDYFRYTCYGLAHLARSSGMTIVAVAPTCGMWATLVQRLADTVAHHYAARLPRPLFFGLCVLLSPILLIGYLLDRACGPQGDTLDNVLVARKPDRTTAIHTPCSTASTSTRPNYARAA